MLWHVAHSATKPTHAIIVFRRGNITRPKSRVTDRYGKKLKALLTDPELERIVTELAYTEKGDCPRGAPFDEVLAHSFVPHMVRVAREAGIQLVLARCKSRSYAKKPGSETSGMKQYTADMTQYLNGQRVHFLDYVHAPEITLEHFANGDHLNEAGRQAWTALMIEDLRALLAGQRAARELTDFTPPAEAAR